MRSARNLTQECLQCLDLLLLLIADVGQGLLEAVYVFGARLRKILGGAWLIVGGSVLRRLGSLNRFIGLFSIEQKCLTRRLVRWLWIDLIIVLNGLRFLEN